MNNSLAAQLSTVLDNISKHFHPVPKQLPETSVDKSPKLVRNTSETYETLSKPDGRSKPRTQRQIESYKKNFSHRHKSKESIPQLEDKASESLPPTLYDEIFSHHKVYKRK
jgi:hypothetical protein